MRVLFTGIVGVKTGVVVENLRRFARESDYRRKVHPVLKAETHFVDVVKETRLLPDETWFVNRSQYMIQALGLPRPLLRKLWSKAFTRVVSGVVSGDDDLFMCMHSVFYHQATREFFSPIDTALVREWKPELVITVIDDIENCLDRLRAEGEMYSTATYAYAGMKGFSNALQHMRLLYDWRASEMLSAERLAADIGVPHFCIAAKHPAETVASLIYRPEAPVYYVSHPISEPRRQLRQGNLAGFESFTRDLEATCSRLRRGMTLIEPTTIDEFRLRSFEAADGRVFLPHHTPRWPVHPDAIWARPAKEELHPLDPGGVFSESLLGEYTEFKQAKEPVGADALSRFIPVEIAANLLSALVGNMKAQIDARDHKLVEQSSGLIVLRPIYVGNVSDGVLEEIRYHCQMCVSGESRPGGLWVYTTDDDEFAWLCTWLYSYVIRALIDGKAEGTGDEENDGRIIREAISGLSPKTNRKELAADILRNLESKGIRLIGRYTNGTLDPRPEVSSGSARVAFIRELEAAKPPYLSYIEEYRKQGTFSFEIRTGPGISLDNFISEVIESGQE